MSFPITSLTAQAVIGTRRDTEDRIIPRSVDADDSDVEVNNDDERLFFLADIYIQTFILEIGQLCSLVNSF